MAARPFVGVDSFDMSVKGTPRSHLRNRLRHDHAFKISANMGYFNMTGRVRLMSPRGRNASRDGLLKSVVAACLLKFACYFVTY